MSDEGETTNDFLELNDFERLAEARRQSTNNLLWQVPGLSVAGQAFLLGAALDPGTPRGLRVGVAVLAAVVALATIQVLMRHRFRELVFSHALDASRESRGLEPIDHPGLFEKWADARGGEKGDLFARWKRLRRLRPGLWPAMYTWSATFVCFLLLDIAVIATAVAKV